MPRALITNTKTFTRSTSAPVALPQAAFPDEVAGDAANDHEFVNDGRTILAVRNAGATPRTLEIEFARGVDGRLPDPLSWTLAASASIGVGPWPVDDFGQLVKVNVDHADVKLALFRLP